MTTFADTIRGWAALEVPGDRRARVTLGVTALVVAMSFAAQVAVPLPWTPVPVTLQPLFVLLAGALLGALPGACAMVAYLMLGAAGAPVFAGGGAGVGWLLGPTGGYLVAMPAAAYLTGRIVSLDAGGVRALAGLVAGVLVMYAGGVSQLFLLTREPLGALLAAGVTPFLVGDATKVVVALALLRSRRVAGLFRS